MGCGQSAEARLLKFVERGDIANVKLVLQEGKVDVNANTGDFTGVSPLIAAARDGNIPIIKALIDAGADVNKKYVSKKIDERRTLVEHPNEGFTAVFEAVANGHDEAVSVLIKAGADPNTPSDMGRRPLHRAVAAEHYAMVLTLVGFNSTDLEAVDMVGQKPIDIILKGANPQIAVCLLEAGAEPPKAIEDVNKVNPAVVEAILRCGYKRNEAGGFDKKPSQQQSSA